MCISCRQFTYGGTTVQATLQHLDLPSQDGTPDVGQGSILFIGTATVLIRYAGFTILTDPNFLHRGELVHLGYGLRSRRLTEPAMGLADLPPLDAIVLSHLHEDHFDRVVERTLDRALPLITTPKAARTLAKIGFHRTVPLCTWQDVTMAKGGVRLRLTAMPGRHGPWLFSRLLPPVMGSMLEFETTTGEPLFRLYITGDTLVHDALHAIPRRYPNIDQALLHLGGTRVLGVLVTMDAKQGVEAIKLIRPTLAIPVHYNDYTVFKSPLSHFQKEVRSAGLEERVRYLNHGDAYTFDVPSGSLRSPQPGVAR
jgi:L-ascorbate metabolism protein UlaG (beta-lactamase superfamily)